MAVTIVPRQCECWKCFEILQYTGADAKKYKKEKRVSIWKDGEYKNGIATYEVWQIVCPECQSKIKAYEFLLSERLE